MTKDIFHLELSGTERKPIKGLASGFSILFRFEDEPSNRMGESLKNRTGDREIHNNIFVQPSSETKEIDDKWNILYLKPVAIEECASEFGLDIDKLKRTIGDSKKIRKSIWIDQLLHRLVFEVNTCGKTASRAAVFCVLELIKEVYYSKSGAIDKLVFNIDSSDIRLQKALGVIEGELDFLWTAEKLGKRVGTSTATLGRLFKNEFGVSTMEFVWDLRLRKAFALLNNTSMGIGEIAFAVGFESLTGFSTSFKRKFGVSPKDLKLKKDL